MVFQLLRVLEPEQNLFHNNMEHSQLQQFLGRSNGFSSRLQNSGNPSQSYGTPIRSLSSQYDAPSANNSASKIGGSARLTNSEINAIVSSYLSARSLKYGAPTSRALVPFQEYGAPASSFGDQSYEYASNSLQILNQKPTNYEFAYKVSDGDTGIDFGHTESRQLDRAEGTYYVLLPDGTKQIVEYEANEDGIKTRISVEPLDLDTALEAEGPY